jgi:hypothetical protein
LVENIGNIWQHHWLDMKPSQDEHTVTEARPTAPVPEAAAHSPNSLPPPVAPREIGGRDGPEPTRFGDWEKAGRCIDF